MSPTMSHLTFPVFARGLTALSANLDKAEAFARAKKIDDSVMLGSRLSPDMFAFARQVQIAADFAKNTMARLTGAELTKFEDNEATFAELRARIAKTLALVQSFDTAAVDASANRDVTFPAGPGMKATLPGLDYLAHFALPNFYFHSAAAYAILRHLGVEVGKRDFIGAVPGFAPVPA